MNDLQYESLHGPIKTPKDHVNFCIFQGRQHGKTQKLLLTLPDEPLVLVVHSNNYGQELIRELKHTRPGYNTKNITIITYQKNNNYFDKLRGRNVPVYFDNAVLDMIQLDYVDMVNKLYGKRN